MPISEKKLASNRRYIEKCDSIQIRPTKEKGERIRNAAEKAGKSLQGYILEALDAKMESEKGDYYTIRVPKTAINARAAADGIQPKQLISEIIKNLL